MPKDKRGSHSSNRSRASPYSRSSSDVAYPLSKNSEWEEARCPVCMEHPHNAVLLQCSSHDKGCRPYMCDTSRRHSNCFDQFCKTSANTPTSPIQDDPSYPSTVTIEATHMTAPESRAADIQPGQALLADDKNLKLVCPLCRGQVNRCIVVEPARRFMNAKTRSCSSETCDFSGTYADLRKHARIEHPLVRPSEVDPERQRDWRRMEQEMDLRDFFSTINSAAGEDRDEVTSWPVLQLVIVFQIPQIGTSSLPSSSSRTRVLRRRQRRITLTTMSNEDLDLQADSDALEDELILSHQRNHHHRNQRQSRE
ncbi:hypothetical protein AQUCO_00100793v1 [Aquilegia coerulea]|uniref:Uncharacterized protein n=1 Tax=Aquilegia coerulea TaxID=218851 RepID=A0A2G5FC05_AQUCA|nr:hypothetical protein AQUCO_00100793v1 [Aquilegia coerulea]